MNPPFRIAGDGLGDTLVQALGEALNPAELDPAQRDRLRSNIVRRSRLTVPEGSATVRAADNAWITIAPKIELRELRRDPHGHNHTSLLRMQPGGVMPPHRHEQEEEFIVLEGECHIGSHSLGPGDAHIAAAGSWHDAVTTASGVLVLLRGEYPYPRESLPRGS